MSQDHILFGLGTYDTLTYTRLNLIGKTNHEAGSHPFRVIMTLLVHVLHTIVT